MAHVVSVNKTNIGAHKMIAAPGSPQFVHLFGAYNWHTGTVLYQTHDRKNSEHFIEFIEHLLTSVLPAQKVVLVLDNASCFCSLNSFDLWPR